MKTKINKIEPLSREFLLNRGYCCNNNCSNCPYKPKKNKMKKKHPYYESDRKQQTETIAMQAIVWCILSAIVMFTLLYLIK